MDNVLKQGENVITYNVLTAQGKVLSQHDSYEEAKIAAFRWARAQTCKQAVGSAAKQHSLYSIIPKVRRQK